MSTETNPHTLAAHFLAEYKDMVVAVPHGISRDPFKMLHLADNGQTHTNMRGTIHFYNPTPHGPAKCAVTLTDITPEELSALMPVLQSMRGEA